MIICHEKKLIFLKTRKTAGTSLEIALSGHCGPNCVITKFSAVDEETRSALGYRGPQNVTALEPNRFLFRKQKDFAKHMRAERIRSLVPRRIWQSYRKFTIVRDPFDRAISRYYWDISRGKAPQVEFDEFYRRYPECLSDNMRIAPLEGPNQLDFYLRYENFEEDMLNNDLGFLWQTFSGLSAKGGHRPKKGTTTAQMYRQFPEVADLIKDRCKGEIDRFGYSSPI